MEDRECQTPCWSHCSHHFVTSYVQCMESLTWHQRKPTAHQELSCLNEATASTTSSVSTVHVRIVTLYLPMQAFCTASAMYISSWVSAYSCEHWTRWAKHDLAGEQRTLLQFFALSYKTRTATRQEIEQFFFVFIDSISKSLQFFVLTVEGVTLLLVSFSLFSLLETFRLEGCYTSLTMPTGLL